jgi:hypothetical protein
MKPSNRQVRALERRHQQQQLRVVVASGLLRLGLLNSHVGPYPHTCINALCIDS